MRIHETISQCVRMIGLDFNHCDIIQIRPIALSDGMHVPTCYENSEHQSVSFVINGRQYIDCVRPKRYRGARHIHSYMPHQNGESVRAALKRMKKDPAQISAMVLTKQGYDLNDLEAWSAVIMVNYPFTRL